MTKLAREHLEAIAFDPNRASEANVQAMALELIVARARMAAVDEEARRFKHALIAWTTPKETP